MRFTSISIIYNPNSTGPSKRLAEECARDIENEIGNTKVALIATEYAGHAEEIAYELATATKYPLIISSSGDGGYHEVVNGIMQAKQESKHAVAGLLPGGNANDHFHHMHETDFVGAIKKKQIRTIDVLKLSGIRHGESFTRYAHSYIGFGLTPRIGRILTRTKLNRWNQIWIVGLSLLSVRSTHLITHDKEKSYRSLVFTNIGRMAKLLNLAHESRVDDGKFEVSTIYKRSRLHLLLSLLKASVAGLSGSEQVTTYSLRTVNKTLVQLDGEIRTLDANSAATVDIEAGVLSCIV